MKFTPWLFNLTTMNPIEQDYEYDFNIILDGQNYLFDYISSSNFGYLKRAINAWIDIKYWKLYKDYS